MVGIVGHTLEVRMEAINRARCRRLAIGRQATSCIGTRVGIGTINPVGIRTHLAIPKGWVAIKVSIHGLKAVNQLFFDGGLHLLFWNC